MPAKRRIVLIHLVDEKSLSWRQAGLRLAMDLRPVPGPVSLFVPLLFWYALTLRRPAACVFRYVNDGRWRWVSWAREAAEVLALAACRLLRVRAIWICHNVDRETVVSWPRAVERRRRRLARRAERVLATDPLLVPSVESLFPEAAGRVAALSFGPMPDPEKEGDVEAATKQIREFLRAAGVARRGTGPPPQEGTLGILIVGAANEKTLHFQMLPVLLDVLEATGRRAVAAAVGPTGRHLRAAEPKAYEAIKTDPRILLIDRYQRVDEARLAPWVSFHFRAYADESVPLTVYNAAACAVPILVVDTGFLPALVEKHRLGAVVTGDLANLGAAIEALSRYDAADAARFLAAQNWETAAGSLAEACGLESADAEEAGA